MEVLKRVIDFFADLFTNKIWSIDTSEMSFFKRRCVRFIKLVRITVDTFAENRMGFQCVSLSYFVALAIVPFVAFLFAVSGGMGMQEQVNEFLFKLIPASPEVISLLVEKARNIINTAKSSGVGLISALTFLWTILWLFFQVERVFNNIWGIRKIPRKIYKRFSFYILVLLLLPFLIFVFGSGIVYYTNLTKLIGLDLGEVNILPRLIGWSIFYLVTIFTFSVMYKFIPAAKVKYKFALKSAVFSALVFVAFQYIYLETQVFVNRLNGVYGALAAIPLFLIWMNFSWQIIMYGAELSYGYHNVDNYHIPEWDNEEI